MTSSARQDSAHMARFIPEMTRLIRVHLGITGPVARAAEQLGDLLVLELPDGRLIGCRVRRFGNAFEPRRYEFTVRSQRASGVETEWARLRRGDWLYALFYGHEQERGRLLISPWMLVSVAAFLAQLDRNPGLVVHENRSPDRNNFKIIDVRSFAADPPALLATDLVLPPPKPSAVPPAQPGDEASGSLFDWARRERGRAI